MGPLPSSLTIVEKTEWDEAKKEEAKKSLEQFLQVNFALDSTIKRKITIKQKDIHYIYSFRVW